MFKLFGIGSVLLLAATAVALAATADDPALVRAITSAAEQPTGLSEDSIKTAFSLTGGGSLTENANIYATGQPKDFTWKTSKAQAISQIHVDHTAHYGCSDRCYAHQQWIRITFADDVCIRPEAFSGQPSLRLGIMPPVEVLLVPGQKLSANWTPPDPGTVFMVKQTSPNYRARILLSSSCSNGITIVKEFD